jgi:hypothetical protein
VTTYFETGKKRLILYESPPAAVDDAEASEGKAIGTLAKVDSRRWKNEGWLNTFASETVFLREIRKHYTRTLW